MNLSPDPQLASINSDLMDRYDKLLLKETKTHNENVELQSKIEELQTTIHNINKFWLDEDDEDFGVEGAVQAMEDSVKDLDNAEGQNEIDREEIVKLKKELKEWSGDGVVMNKAGVMLFEELKKENEELKEQVDRLREKLDIASKEHLACLDKINTFYEKKEKDWEEKVKDLKLQMKHESGWTPDWAYEVGDYIREIEYLKKENKTPAPEEEELCAPPQEQVSKCRDGTHRPNFEASCFNEGAEFGRSAYIKENEELKKDLKTFKDAVVEALGGPEFNGPYKDCIRLRDITCEIAALKNPNLCDPETGEIIGLKEFGHLKEENKTLKDVMENQQSIREEYEKEMREIKIAMGCDGPLSWDIKDILKWIDRAKCYTGGPSQAYERLVDKNNNDNLNFGDILFEREEEIKRLTEAHLEMKVKQLSQKKEIKRLTKTLQLAEDKIKDLKDEDDCLPDAWDAM